MKKIIICILVFILILGSIFMITKKKSINLVGKQYEIPLIESVSYRDNTLLVNAGNYVYGDINQDGLINESDILAIDFIIKDELKYSESQKILADLNQDKKIDNKDKDILNEYLDNNNEYKYEYGNDILYCINSSEDENSCNFQNDKYIRDVDFSQGYHYLLIKNSKSNKVGIYKYTYNNY